MKGGIEQLPQLLKRDTGGLIRSVVKTGVKTELKKGLKTQSKKEPDKPYRLLPQPVQMPLEETNIFKKAVLDQGLEGLQKTGKTMEQKYLPAAEIRVLLAKGGRQKRKSRRKKNRIR